MHRLVIIVSLLLTLVIGSSAQESTTDLIFDLLDAIPDLPMSREMTTLVDRDAVTLAYPDAQKPTTLEELLAADTDGHAVYWRVFSQLGDATAQDFAEANALPERLGIEFMQIGKTAVFGTPPNEGMVLSGDFDTTSVESALSIREYTFTENGVWCYQSDCNNGLAINLTLYEPGDPFGGNLGRTQPIIVGDTRLISSASAVITAAAQAVQDDTAPSLSDDPAYQAIADVLSAEGIVVQTIFVDGEMLLNTSLRNSREPLDESVGYAPIAPYRLYAFADVVTETEQVGITAFVFTSEDEATAALEQMQFRLGVLESLATRQSWQALLDDRNVTLSSTVVPVGDLFVSILRFSTPKATTEEILAASAGSSGDVVQPGLIYLRLLYTSFIQQDQQWRVWG